MKLERHYPRPPLGRFVEYFWHLSDAPEHTRERVLPNGTMELVFNLAEDEVRIYGDAAAEPRQRLSGAVVSGVFSRFFVIDTREHAGLLGVHFKPGGAFPFLRRMPALELADSHADLAAVWGSAAGRLRESLAAAPTVEQRFQRIEAALVAELRHAAPRHRAVAPAMHALASGSAAVRVLAERANLTHRRLIEVFGAEVGATPKLFHRLRRFQRALSLARTTAVRAPLPSAAGVRPSWAHVAQLAGYCDQSHWVRECVALSGLSPADYFRQWTERVKDDHLPLASDPPAAELER